MFFRAPSSRDYFLFFDCLTAITINAITITNIIIYGIFTLLYSVTASNAARIVLTGTISTDVLIVFDNPL